ncbi:15940_t:CDS:2, partial [Funneliformis mosseae]
MSLKPFGYLKRSACNVSSTFFSPQRSEGLYTSTNCCLNYIREENRKAGRLANNREHEDKGIAYTEIYVRLMLSKRLRIFIIKVVYFRLTK